MLTRVLLGISLAFLSMPTLAKLNVVTTTTDLASLVREIGGSEVEVFSICKGTQDPHYLEAKPSYMLKVANADLLIAVGLSLEEGWVGEIIRGGRNPKVAKGNSGYLEVGEFIEPLEVASSKVTRKDGDVHPSGNPHFMLDPIRVGKVALGISKRLSELSPAHQNEFNKRAHAIDERLQAQTKQWQKQIDEAKLTKVVTYHKTLTYFLDRFKISNPIMLEPKPGIPPSGAHTLAVIRLVKDEKIPVIAVENYFETSIAKKIASEVGSDVRVISLPVAVEGEPGLDSLDKLFDRMIALLAQKRGHGS